MNHELEGKQYHFEDGHSIEVIQVKSRDEGKLWVHYMVKHPGSLPRKLVMDLHEFNTSFGHLFK